jgi:hypothetical protein
VHELQGEMNKIKPPTFDGEDKKDEDAETSLLGMGKYFQLHNYSAHTEGRISIYHLKGKASMWWDQFVQVQHIDEKNVTWREFKRCFQKKYLTKRYYDKKMKEFFELKLGSMTIDEYERRYLELLKYVSFIKEDPVTSRSTEHTIMELFFKDTCLQVIQVWYIVISFRLWVIYYDVEVLWIIDLLMYIY